MPDTSPTPPLRERLSVMALRLLPKRVYSDMVGFCAQRPLPRPVRGPIYRAFARRVGAEVDEAEQPLAEYPTFGAFFARRLREGLRPIDARPDVVASPCDGTLSQAGTIDRDRLLQAKGHEYTLAELLRDAAAAERFAGGFFATIYLAPRDYHRVHAPLDGAVTGFHRIPGRRFPVNPPSVRNVPRLFARNERVVTHLETALGRVALVMVGATAVGRMPMAYDREASTKERFGAGRRTEKKVEYPSPKPIRKGDEVGAFELGSTVILLFQAHRVLADGSLVPGRRLKCGQPLVRVAEPTAGRSVG